MSVLREPTADDRARWAARDARGIEPVTLPLGDHGWMVSEAPARDAAQPNLHVWTYVSWTEIPELAGFERPDDRRTYHRVDLRRWWDQPLTPGGPMQVASTRTVTTAAGRALEVHTTSIFEGAPSTVDVVFLHGTDWHVRITFAGMDREAVDAAVAHVRVT